MAILEVQDLSKTYPSNRQTEGFRNISFSMAKGEALGLVGESGCGKTTLARTILRLIPPDGGRIWFQGDLWLDFSGRALREKRKNMQAVFQDPESSLNPLMTNRAIVEEPLKIHRIGDRAQRQSRVNDLLAHVGLPREIKHRRPAMLSGGQKQRLALARALATEPALLIADEPLSALDLSIQLQVLSLLKKLRRDYQLTVFFISHSIGAARHLCDRIAVMRDGRILELAPAEVLFSKPAHPYAQFLIDSYRSETLPSEEREEYEKAPSEWREVEPGHWLLT